MLPTLPPLSGLWVVRTDLGEDIEEEEAFLSFLLSSLEEKAGFFIVLSLSPSVGLFQAEVVAYFPSKPPVMYD